MYIEFIEDEKPIKQPKKRPHRATSTEAHESVKEHKEGFYKKIIEALEELKVGATSEEVSIKAGITLAQTHKRLPELVTKGIVYNVGTTRPTSTGRNSMIRQLEKFRYSQ